MCADANGAALVRLLQQFGGSQSTLGTEGLVVLLAETAHALKCANDEGYSSQLGFGVADLILVEREGLGSDRKTHSLILSKNFRVLKCLDSISVYKKKYKNVQN